MTRWTPRRILAAAAVAAGALAPLAGSPYLDPSGPIDIARLAAEIDRAGDRVTAPDLARWIEDRKPGLHVIDVRPASEFNAFHLPGAQHVPLASIAATRIAVTDTIVIYSDESARAAQAWVCLRALGFAHVYFLRGGVNEWLDAVSEASVSAAPRPAAPAEHRERPRQPRPAQPPSRRSRFGC